MGGRRSGGWLGVVEEEQQEQEHEEQEHEEEEDEEAGPASRGLRGLDDPLLRFGGGRAAWMRPWSVGDGCAPLPWYVAECWCLLSVLIGAYFLY